MNGQARGLGSLPEFRNAGGIIGNKGTRWPPHLRSPPKVRQAATFVLARCEHSSRV